MLILTRKAEERILIGESTVVAVLEIEGNRVKLGIEAPREVTILREELIDDDAGAVAGDAADTTLPKAA